MYGFNYAWIHTVVAFFWKLLHPTARTSPMHPEAELVVCIVEHPSRALPFWILGVDLPASCALPWSWLHPLTWVAHLLPRPSGPTVPVSVISTLEELKACAQGVGTIQMYVPPTPGQLGKLYPLIQVQEHARDSQLVHCFEMALQHRHASTCRRSSETVPPGELPD